MYLSYDIRGIQQYVFAVPRLKYVIGGSALIDKFDRQTVPALASRTAGRAHIFSGGGRGLFKCDGPETAAGLTADVVGEAHKLGLDVRIGCDDDVTRAATSAEQLYSCQVEDLAGEPCSASGLFPVSQGQGCGFRDSRKTVHPLIWQRVAEARADRVGTELLRLIEEHEELPAFGSRKPSLMRNVSPDPDDDPAEAQLARRGCEALGARNRWAIIAMDGNDMGLQHRAAATTFREQPDRYESWLRRMSVALDRCTRLAAARALKTVINAWLDTDDSLAAATEDEIVLPFRPLIVGGDDIILLSHCRFALPFVEAACKHFEQLSAEEDPQGDLWLATSGRLTISAGVLFTSTSFPLAAGMRYAESLLGSAKGAGRQAGRKDAAPSPAALDWEQLTEGAIDTPAARRNRELRFKDLDEQPPVIVELTRRPWLLRDLPALRTRKDQLADLPASIRHELLSSLHAAKYERLRYVASLKKRQPQLAELLREGYDGGKLGDAWRVERAPDKPDRLTTDAIDACLLLEEERRMERETAR